MKKNIHPDYYPVTFRDSTNGDEYTIPSTLGVQDSVKVIPIDVSASSHPYWTGRAETRKGTAVEAFQRRYGSK